MNYICIANLEKKKKTERLLQKHTKKSQKRNIN